ncbi:MAG: hypothetical protein SVR81_10720, partial [Chloroflexota bacterium]|nr:hypothetical protein [Chloroflexota bacterium]
KHQDFVLLPVLFMVNAGKSSALKYDPGGFTTFAILPVPLSGEVCLLCSLLESSIQTRLPFSPSPCKQVSLLAVDGRYAIDYYGLC